jgi:glycosyltransferase involved in cell wall biosynthesis
MGGVVLLAAACAQASAAVLDNYDDFLAARASGTLPPRRNDEDLAVHWMAPFFSGGGYCSEAAAFVQGLVASGRVRASIEQHGDGVSQSFVDGLPTFERQMLVSLASRRPVAAQSIVICHSEPGAWHINASLPQRWSTARCPPVGAAYRVGRTMFETDRLPSGWADRLNAMDEVWVPTTFARDVFAAGGVDAAKLLVVPEPVDASFFAPAWHAGTAGAGGRSPHVPPRACVEGEHPGNSAACPFRFLSVGKFERRKGFDVLLRAFLTAFVANSEADAAAATPGADAGGAAAVKQPHVELMILTSAYHTSHDFDAAIAAMLDGPLACPEGEGAGAAANGQQPLATAPRCVPTSLEARRRLPRVRMLHGVPQRELPEVYASADAFVLASRGEGWGRPHVEAMALGLPVIATLWSGPSAFMTEANSYPLRHTHLEPIPDGAFAGHLQAEPDVEHLVALMQRVVAEPEEARARGAAARADMEARFSPELLGEWLERHVDRISRKVDVRREGTAAGDAAGSGGIAQPAGRAMEAKRKTNHGVVSGAGSIHVDNGEL